MPCKLRMIQPNNYKQKMYQLRIIVTKVKRIMIQIQISNKINQRIIKMAYKLKVNQLKIKNFCQAKINQIKRSLIQLKEIN